ncbi:PrgI family protein [Candidatus Saccharibacteria bacterium]|nr:PrgI family protein [Candidatus Saccharibacteria bacterium]
MAVYKVPQDVEADDKLIGPFSFRQFIYLIAVALAGVGAWGLFQIFPVLVIIPLPIIVFFGALALPLRKDQPMEIYMAAMVSFYLKPRKRLWEADGIESLIEITVPKTVEFGRTKNLSQGEAQERLGYLAELVDSGGWAVRGRGVQAPNSALNSDVYFEAQQVEDVLDSGTSVAQSLDLMIGQSDAKRHQDMIERMHQTPTVAPGPTAQPVTNPYDVFAPQQPVVPEPASQIPSTTSQLPTFNPYPSDIQQSVIQPIGAGAPTQSPIPPPAPPVQTTSEKPLSAGIINLANNADLSIETIAREAHRIKQQEEMSEEVVISLR